jgi:hypothetical protein
MTERKDDEGTKPDDLLPDDAKLAESKRSGRVAFDARGNPIWEWQLETGVYSRDVTTQKLKKLDLGDLSLVETGTHKQPSGLNPAEAAPAPRKERTPGAGFNPYDSAPLKGSEGSNPYDNARALGKKATPAPTPDASARKPTDLRKLDEWIKLKKSVGDNKDD